MSFGRYPAYKDSGVAWLGEVPAEWAVKRIGYFFNERREKVSDKDYPALSVTKHGIVPQLDTAAKSDDGDNRKRVAKGDFVINSRSDRKGSAGASDLDGSVSLICTVMRPQEAVHTPFIHHLLRSVPFQEEFYRNGKGIVADLWSTNYSEMRNILLGMPPLPDQTRIAAFLDRETAKIDGLVAEQQRLIDLLKEKRQAVISHAVTKGLNPAAPMKPSGIEWLGNVPAHWTVTRVRYAAEVLDHLRVPVEVAERGDRQGEYPYYGASGIIDTIDGYLFDEPLVLVCEDGWNLVLRTQLVARPVAGKIWVNNHAHILRPIEGNYEFLAAAIELAPFEAFVSGMRQPKLTSEMLKDIPVALPPNVAEQNAIREFIQCASHKFDTLTAEAQRAIDLLQERRTALISAAVTGQIDVRHLAEAGAA